jgi:FKBP-type peptidyl-prolyl cis-trans isomerase 2
MGRFSQRDNMTEANAEGKVRKGDIITLDYDAWIINPDGTEELFDTTSEEHAKAGEIYDEKTKYAPIVTVAGEGRVLGGLDASLTNAEIGKKSTVEIPPSEGAGERNPNLVEIHSIRELQKQNIDPEPGMRVQLKNRLGTIMAVTSGRVRIDFNDPLAGKTVKYEYTVLKRAESMEEKVLGLIQANYGRSEEFGVKVGGDSADVTLPDLCKYDNIWFTLKYKLVSDLRELLGLKTIRFVEEYIKKEEPEEEEADGSTETEVLESEDRPSEEIKEKEVLEPEELPRGSE